MQHETISLKEEKLLIKEINDLKAQQKQLCSSMGSKAEINEAFDQKEHIHERHKVAANCDYPFNYFSPVFILISFLSDLDIEEGFRCFILQPEITRRKH
jgi:hypothetical protein